MTIIVIRIKDKQKITDGGVDTASSDSTVPIGDSLNVNHHLDPDSIIELLDQVPEDRIHIRQSTHHPHWSRGDPCPKCGNTELAVMELRETTYESSGGEFRFDHLDDGMGPQLSVVCKECHTHLSHVPYHSLTD